MKPNSNCPYCARPFGDGGGSTKDHVFVGALGGHFTVSACRDCNSRIGSDIEGKLLKTGSALHLLRQLNGARQWLRGKFGADEVEIEHRFGDPGIRFVRPVTTKRDKDKVEYQITAGLDQAKELLEQITVGLGLDDDEVNGIWASRKVQSVGDQFIQMDVSYDLILARRLAVKVALGACGLVYGDNFIVSSLADEMRTILWNNEMAGESCSNEILVVMEQYLSGLSIFDEIGFSTLRPSAEGSQVSLVPVGRQLAVFVTLCGWDVTFGNGPLFSTAQPVAGQFPVLILDGTPVPTVRDVTADVGSALQRLQQSEILDEEDDDLAPE